jgi:uncharacterized membrane protein
MLGVSYAVISAAFFGFNNASSRRGALTGTAIQGLAISLPLGVLTFLVMALAVGEWSEISKLSTKDTGFLAAGGFMHFVWGRYFNIRSLAAIGSNLAGPVQQFQLLLSLILAILFLGETLSPLNVLGIILIVSAPTYIFNRRAKMNRALPLPTTDLDVHGPMPQGPSFQPRMKEGYITALLAGVGFGVSPVLVKAGLEDTGLSLVGGFVSYAAATVVIIAILMIPRQLTSIQNMNRHSLKWFAFSGLSVSFSQLFRYLALGIAPVSIVQPLLSLSLIFRMIFGFVVNRDHEQFDRHVIVGIMLSFLGALALSFSEQNLLGTLDLPPWLASLSAWR